MPVLVRVHSVNAEVNRDKLVEVFALLLMRLSNYFKRRKGRILFHYLPFSRPVGFFGIGGHFETNISCRANPEQCH